ncbi:C-GCAxxG-C-C family protein [Ruminococcus flavefaciens]|uniref:C-GCAxxG-C-C family protein n=1 Tax=Ruminococcus flavefaciens TaxID=1265 RepID=UPI0026F1F823|nr:C-GCAxxG-C-C family protein [Ruminococcus flavefaciens]
MDNVSKAFQYYEEGYMCSQAVFAAFAEQFGITEKQAFQIGACFGGGNSDRNAWK